MPTLSPNSRIESPPVRVVMKKTGDGRQLMAAVVLAIWISRWYIVGIMRKVLLLSLMLVALSVVISAQEKKLSSAPKSFRTFYATFKTTMERGDKAGVAAMTRFPFSWGLDAGDEGKYTRAQFLRNFRRLFEPYREILRERNPRYGRDDDGTYYISTDDAAHFGFVKSGRTYKFFSYIVEP